MGTEKRAYTVHKPKYIYIHCTYVINMYLLTIVLEFKTKPKPNIVLLIYVVYIQVCTVKLIYFRASNM